MSDGMAGPPFEFSKREATPQEVAAREGSSRIMFTGQTHPETWPDGKPEEAKSWRCFHCDEVFTDEARARDHFGEALGSGEIPFTPICLTDAHAYRELEAELLRYREEDTDMHRHIRELEADAAAACQRAEERGYDRGVRDMTKERDAALAAMKVQAKEIERLQGKLDIARDGLGAALAAISWSKSVITGE